MKYKNGKFIYSKKELKSFYSKFKNIIKDLEKKL